MPVRQVILVFALGFAVGLSAPVTVEAQDRSRQTSSAPAAEIHDIVIINGRLMDPESGLDAIRSVGIRAGRIQAISVEPLQGRATIDAAGLVVAPGFIDLDSYAHLARFQVQDGVTSLFDIRRGTAHVSQWYADHESKMPVNFGVGVGYSLVREEVMGAAGSLDRERVTQASDAQLTEILQRIRKGLDEGAVGIGMGPSLQSSPPSWELLETFRVGAQANAHVVATVRDAIWKTTDVPAILSEIIGAGAMSGAAIHIPHLGSSGGPHVPRMLAMIERARERGLDVTAEDYPYTAAVIRLRPEDPTNWSDAELAEVQVIATGETLNRDNFARYTAQHVLAIVHNNWIEPFVIEGLKSPFTSIASHGYLDDQLRGHPRTSGTYSRLLGRYVRERKTLSLMEALRKITLMPAQRLEARVPAMRNKGRIREGADADVVVFDPGRIIDRATFQEPTRPPEGVRHVLVNGVLVVRNGVLVDGVYPGRPVRAALQIDPAKKDEARKGGS